MGSIWFDHWSYFWGYRSSYALEPEDMTDISYAVDATKLASRVVVNMKVTNTNKLVLRFRIAGAILGVAATIASYISGCKIETEFLSK
jgi:hypothetical protein